MGRLILGTFYIKIAATHRSIQEPGLESVSSEKSVVMISVLGLNSDPQPTLGLSEDALLTQCSRLCFTPTLGFEPESSWDTARESDR